MKTMLGSQVLSLLLVFIIFATEAAHVPEPTLTGEIQKDAVFPRRSEMTFFGLFNHSWSIGVSCDDETLKYQAEISSETVSRVTFPQNNTQSDKIINRCEFVDELAKFWGGYVYIDNGIPPFTTTITVAIIPQSYYGSFKFLIKCYVVDSLITSRCLPTSNDLETAPKDEGKLNRGKS
ncbi:unnamed protein product [Bemisia tabaci]|uniref:Uncharacterized protein n=1 Tax=Bemisia tabaci TaxID=7038 RepID=A0A9P0C488_BEMTA|nr:unnamed protein product [Bemisia tabaci]